MGAKSVHLVQFRGGTALHVTAGGNIMQVRYLNTCRTNVDVNDVNQEIKLRGSNSNNKIRYVC